MWVVLYKDMLSIIHRQFLYNHYFLGGLSLVYSHSIVPYTCGLIFPSYSISASLSHARTVFLMGAKIAWNEVLITTDCEQNSFLGDSVCNDEGLEVE